MRHLRIGLAQLNPTVGDLEGNGERIVRAIEAARAQGVELLAFPELVVTGYPPEDLLLKPAFIEQAVERTRALCSHTRGMTVVVGSVERDVDLYNAAVVLHDGAWVGTYRKRYLPNYGVFDENRYFQAAASSPVFARGRSVFGVNICEDIWYPGDPLDDQVIHGGAEIIINISASPYHAGKAQARRRMLCTRASDNLAVVAYVNLVGGQDEILFDGASLIVDQTGKVLAEGEMFAEDLVVADVELDAVFNARLHDARLRKRAAGRPDHTERLELPPLAGALVPGGGHAGVDVATASEGATAAVAVAAPARPKRAARPAPRERQPLEEIYDALALGVRDYVTKNGFKTVVLGLSGGVDSALTAVIAADALGAGQVVGVSMPSRYTSAASREDAELLARALGLRFYLVPIDEVFDSYLRALQPPFADRAPDVTEENIQARVRGNYLMALSNKFGWLVLTTGNKSEVSVGYCTLYGDTAGGFAVLKDVYKTAVYDLTRWRNAREGKPVIPERTITRPPTAELRENQTDQDSLPPYEVLDPILKLYVEEDRAVPDIVGLGFDRQVVEKVARMVDQSEYKRRQAPPGIKITPRAFGRDRRLPITNRFRG
jgi:NAD+ synthase (glutamine-hydrolysing)